MRKLVNGKYVDMTEEEIQQAQNEAAEAEYQERIRPRTEMEGLLALAKTVLTERIAESEDKTLGIACMALFPVWERGDYAAGDVRTDPATGYPYECHTPHDSVSNPGDDWTIKNRALWKPWHSRSAEYALPWEAPTAAYDMYKVGEYMIWTDGTVRRCKADTDRGPDVLPDYWEMVG